MKMVVDNSGYVDMMNTTANYYTEMKNSRGFSTDSVTPIKGAKKAILRNTFHLKQTMKNDDFCIEWIAFSLNHSVISFFSHIR